MHHSLIVQEAKIHYSKPDSAASELLSLIWNALEEITKPSSEARNNALDQLIEVNAPQRSPVVAYILATHLADPDIVFRVRAVKVLGNALSLSENGRGASENVREVLLNHLSQFRTRQIFSILQALAEEPSISPETVNILDACRFSGNHLLDILQDTNAPYPVRYQAANMLGQVGCVDAIPSIERISRKIEHKMHQQSKNAFPAKISEEEKELLDVIHSTLDILNTP